MANEKTNGLNNLKTINQIQKEGVLQELLRDLRSTKSQLEMLVKNTSRFIAAKKEKEKEVEKPIQKEEKNEAIEHINRFGTKHSECIVTESLRNAELFQQRVDAAAVYVNASTRFTDGFEFGLGAEIGISTQKLHARGPMGLKELTSSKYIIYGEGQIR